MHVRMRPVDLSELYSLLMLYGEVYGETEHTPELLRAIKEEYDTIAKNYPDPIDIHNPRNAGRKPRYSREENERIMQMRGEGKTIREIAAQIPCSIGHVQKLINEQSGWNIRRKSRYDIE